ncbi:hypothetical protein Pth03_66620 [Planotetraspora thailandica]|uniref:Uncharacterized protein n=1 Tax=Planotetraspora thailandica TaxID=487172 RepID=A0A8J4DD07_9ACTN|nr:hypothetical protein [Planotetraspora thailandica]GII58273.1 hypothetical protein Pth03_66620 [Planotetraspora thailandica]
MPGATDFAVTKPGFDKTRPAHQELEPEGRTVTDHTEIAAELERDISLGLPLEAKARHVFVAGDIVQIVLD